MTERKRAGDVRASMLRGMTVPSRPAPAVSDDDAVTPVGEAQPAVTAEPERPKKRGVPDNTTKYTANLDLDTATEFDALALAARRKLGRRVDKSEIMKALIRLAADDASLKDQVISEVEKSGR
jgi:hypothetical protein